MFQKIIFHIFIVFLGYMPYAIATSVIVFTALYIIFRLILGSGFKSFKRKYKKKIIITYILYLYCFIVVCLTFLSREPGSRDGVDLKIFSTFSHKLGDNIFPVENILLFLPFGLLLPLLWNKFYKIRWCIAAAFIFSLSIEVGQYITKRGYFQMDDIITNILGAVIGNLIISLFPTFTRKQNRLK